MQIHQSNLILIGNEINFFFVRVGPTRFNFSKLAVEMNEMDDSVAPTDSRRRPDQRLMEDGEWDEANEVKSQLEDKQRKARKKAEADAERAAKRGKNIF